jgi:hypothetical protein
MSNEQVNFEVKVEGEYFARSGVMGAEVVIKNYEVVVKLPTMDRAMSVIKNKLLRLALSAKYEDFKAPRTWNITSIKPGNEASKKAMKGLPVMYLDREALVGMIDDQSLAVDASLYPSLYKLREAITLCKANPEHFKKQQEINRPGLIEDQILADLNPGLIPKTSTTATVPVPAPTPVPAENAKKALTEEENSRQTEDRVRTETARMIKEGALAPMDPVPAPAPTGVEDL